MKIPGKVKILEDTCKGCGLCTHACPFKLIKISDKLNSSGFRPASFEDKEGKCAACGFCFKSCPDAAIEVWVEEG